MSIFSYYARDNKEAIYKNRISAGLPHMCAAVLFCFSPCPPSHFLAIAESAGKAEMLENNGACQISLGKWCGLEKNEEK